MPLSLYSQFCLRFHQLNAGFGFGSLFLLVHAPHQMFVTARHEPLIAVVETGNAVGYLISQVDHSIGDLVRLRTFVVGMYVVLDYILLYHFLLVLAFDYSDHQNQIV
uniref:ORFX n=1 Tax=Simian foamy virus TaxID=11642 RepID=A0A2Z5HTN6_9RETR|nr:ORFX [Simian foamy virus]